MRTQLLNANQLEIAVNLLRQGQLVAIPTETVYGLGASLFNANAIKKIFDIKKRPHDNPLIVHCTDLTQLEQVVSEIPPLFETLAECFMPGPLTIILPKATKVPKSVTAALDTVAIRFPAHPVARKLIDLLGEPIVAPSANLSGYVSPTTARHVLDDLNGKIAAVIDGGRCEFGLESTVIDLTQSPPRILRPGVITQKKLEFCTGVVFMQSDDDKSIRSPGMKYRHYSPRADIRLISTFEEIELICEKKPSLKRQILALNIPAKKEDLDVIKLTERNLYVKLREADKQGMSEILVLADQNLRANVALYNRLKKAAGL